MDERRITAPNQHLCGRGIWVKCTISNFCWSCCESKITLYDAYVGKERKSLLGSAVAREQNTDLPAASAVAYCSAVQKSCRHVFWTIRLRQFSNYCFALLWRSCWTCFQWVLLQACIQELLERLYSREVSTWDTGKNLGRHKGLTFLRCLNVAET